MPVQVERPTVMEFDHIMEEHKQRKFADVAEAERQRILVERSRDETNQQLGALQDELASTKSELATFKAELEQRKAEWNASVKRIQEQLGKREVGIKAGEDDLARRQSALTDSEGRNRHQWTLLREAVDNLKAKLTKQFAAYQVWEADFLKGLPSDTDSSQTNA